jgi:hypothetical protein
MNFGRLAELRQQQLTLRVEIDSAVRSIIYLFDPLDSDLAYVDNIIPDRLAIYVKTIERKMKLLNKLNVEIKRVEAELGESAS